MQRKKHHTSTVTPTRYAKTKKKKKPSETLQKMIPINLEPKHVECIKEHFSLQIVSFQIFYDATQWTAVNFAEFLKIPMNYWNILFVSRQI